MESSGKTQFDRFIEGLCASAGIENVRNIQEEGFLSVNGLQIRIQHCERSGQCRLMVDLGPFAPDDPESVYLAMLECNFQIDMDIPMPVYAVHPESGSAIATVLLDSGYLQEPQEAFDVLADAVAAIAAGWDILSAARSGDLAPEGDPAEENHFDQFA